MLYVSPALGVQQFRDVGLSEYLSELRPHNIHRQTSLLRSWELKTSYLRLKL